MLIIHYVVCIYIYIHDYMYIYIYIYLLLHMIAFPIYKIHVINEYRFSFHLHLINNLEILGGK